MTKFIGIGACGNKAVIDLINGGIIPRNKAMLINSTLKDVTSEFHDITSKIGDNRGGCGKERKLAKEMALASIKGSTLDLDSFIDPQDDTVIIINGSEGGTGCGAAPIIAEYYKDVHNLNVHIILFTGFEEDARGLQNTVGYFSELREDFIIQAISNKKFLQEANGNKIKAEKLANLELISRMKSLLGQCIVDSEQNIDETDLYKVATTPGYMTIETADIDKSIKNKEQFNSLLINMIDNSKSVDVYEPGCKRLAIILNVSEKTRDIIDYSFDAIKNKLGVPYEIFTHIQYEDTMEEFIDIIASGMKMPNEEVNDIYDKYVETANKVNTKKDSFFDSVKEMAVSNDDMFNSAKGPDTFKAAQANRAKFLERNSISNTPEQEIANEKTKIVKREAFANKY